jgi:hypothetical protein
MASCLNCSLAGGGMRARLAEAAKRAAEEMHSSPSSSSSSSSSSASSSSSSSFPSWFGACCRGVKPSTPTASDKAGRVLVPQLTSKETIDVWWVIHDGGLLLLMSFLLQVGGMDETVSISFLFACATFMNE